MLCKKDVTKAAGFLQLSAGQDAVAEVATEVATRGVLWKKLFLEISQNLQENTCARVF